MYSSMAVHWPSRRRGRSGQLGAAIPAPFRSPPTPSGARGPGGWRADGKSPGGCRPPGRAAGRPDDGPSPGSWCPCACGPCWAGNGPAPSPAAAANAGCRASPRWRGREAGQAEVNPNRRVHRGQRHLPDLDDESGVVAARAVQGDRNAGGVSGQRTRPADLRSPIFGSDSLPSARTRKAAVGREPHRLIVVSGPAPGLVDLEPGLLAERVLSWPGRALGGSCGRRGGGRRATAAAPPPTPRPATPAQACPSLGEPT